MFLLFDMEITVIDALIVLGAILVLGFIGNYIFNKTQIPSIIWLLLFGFFVGIAFNIQEINEALLSQVSSLFGAIAIIIILFDGGINTDLHQLFRGAPRGLLLTITGFCLSLIITMFVIVGLSFSNILPIPLNQSIVVGLILGAIVAGTSSPIVIPLASRLKNLQEKTKMVLSIESILTDPLCIVVVLAAVFMITTPNASIGDGIKSLVSTFAVGGVVGALLGLLWLPIMHKIRKEQFSYIVTLAVVFLIYSLTESWWGGAGALSCLTFGLVLGNGKKILKMLNYSKEGFEMDLETKQFHSLTSFVIRTFFFVYLGMMVSFQKIEFILIGIIVLIALLVFRYIAVWISTFKGGFEKDDKQTMAVLMPRGLAAAILAINFGPILVSRLGLSTDLNSFFKDIAFVVILGTAIITTIGVSIISHIERKKMKQSEASDSQNIDHDKIDDIINKKNQD
jgi:cell volume regulation protein A